MCVDSFRKPSANFPGFRWKFAGGFLKDPTPAVGSTKIRGRCLKGSYARCGLLCGRNSPKGIACFGRIADSKLRSNVFVIAPSRRIRPDSPFCFPTRVCGDLWQSAGCLQTASANLQTGHRLDAESVAICRLLQTASDCSDCLRLPQTHLTLPQTDVQSGQIGN